MTEHTFTLTPMVLKDFGAGPGTLVLHPCPGKDGQPADDIRILQGGGLAAVVTLVEAHELALLDVRDLGAHVTVAGAQWFHLPINDDHAPDSGFESHWAAVAPRLHQLLDDGKRISIHCRGGVGRTGLIAARLLLERGLSLEDARAAVLSVRPNSLKLAAHVQYLERLSTLLKTTL